MDKKELNREQISMLVDGELNDALQDQAFIDLRRADAQADWEIYHQIGDVLQSDDMAVQLSPQFSARLAARLEAEPPFIAPISKPIRKPGIMQPRMMRNMIGAAAIATFAFIATPQMIATFSGDAPKAASIAIAEAPAAPQLQAPDVSTVSADTGDVILRDSSIDDYLSAHQRYSPFVYSSAHYVRSATFSNK